MTQNKTAYHSIVHAHYGCAMAAAYTVLGIPGAVPISNCSPGCIDQQIAAMNTCNGFQGTAGIGCSGIPGSSIGEKEIVFGGAKKLEDVIRATLKIAHGDLFVVLSGCAPQLVGDDVGAVIKRFRDRNIPIVHAEVPGFQGNNLYGHETVVKAIIDQFVGDGKPRKRRTLINLWGPAPYFHTFWRGDLAELKRLLTRCGFEVNTFFGAESKGVEEWKSIPKAAFNLVVSPWLGLDIAKHLKEKYSQPYLHIPTLPIGEEATSAFLRQVEEFAMIPSARSEKLIAEESHRYYYYLEHFASFFSEWHFDISSSFASVGDAAYTLAYTKFLADQIGLIPVRQIITDNTPMQYRETIQGYFNEILENEKIPVEYHEDGYLAEESLRKAAFQHGLPLILGSAWEKDAAKELGALLIEIGTPVTSEVVLHRTYIGYTGALSLLEAIYSGTVKR